MFLFENFTYDKEWAEKNYANYRSTWSYIDSIINDPKDLEGLSSDKRRHFIFSVHSSSVVFGDLKIFAIQTYFDSNEVLSQDQKDYIFNKLEKLGKSITILDKNANDGKSILIAYDITKDEYRWNSAHDKLAAHENAIENLKEQLPEPGMDEWLFMLSNMYNRKNAKLIFKKITDYQTLLKYFIIAFKLNWPKAVYAIDNQLVFKCDKKTDYNDISLLKEAVKRYIKTYQPDEEIQELINDFSGSFKNDGPIPIKGKAFAEKLDESDIVIKYKMTVPIKNSVWTPILIIEVELSNGRGGCIAIQKYSLYRMTCYPSREKISETQIGKDNKFGRDAKEILIHLDQALKEIYEQGRVL